MTTISQNFDVIVIGGGPAGMMAAGRAAELGAKVVLLEKNQRLGIKLLVTGNGRCNITNNISNKEFIEEIGINGKFLHSSLNKFGPQEMMEFLTGRGLRLKVEEHNRVFPRSNRAIDVLTIMQKYLDEGRVVVKFGSEVIRLIKNDTSVSGVVLHNGQKIIANNIIITTGGKSFPETGSTGSGYVLAKSCGHKIVNLRPALTAINCRETWLKELEGVSLLDVNVSLYTGDKLNLRKRGALIFTSNGVSGPVILDLSGHTLALTKNSHLKLVINFFPDLKRLELEEYMQLVFHREGGKQLKNGLAKLIPTKLVSHILSISKVNGDKKMSEITRGERNILASIIHEFKLFIDGSANFDRAYVTAGGVNLQEINPKTMRSLLMDNLYFAGEVLDLNGPTGGFNLQIAWTTGFVAGQAAV